MKVKSDHCSKFSNLNNWKEGQKWKMEKFTGNWKIYCDDHSFHINFTSFHFTGRYELNKIDLAPNVWLHSSVGRASHRYHGGLGFESR